MVDFHTKTLDELEDIKDKISNEFSKIIAYEKTVQVVERVSVVGLLGVWGNRLVIFWRVWVRVLHYYRLGI